MKENIFIVDDSSQLRASVRHLLENEPGFQVCGEAIDGVDAVEKAGKLNPDLVVLDVSMPNMNGIEAAHALRQLLPAVFIIMFTMYKSRLAIAEAFAAGANTVVFKGDGIGLLRAAQRLLAPGQLPRTA